MSDEESIRLVLARFIQLRDDKRYREWVDCFHEDGIFEYASNRLLGRDAIRDNVSQLLAGDRGKHLCMNSIIEVNGDAANVSSDFVKLDPLEGATPARYEIVATGRYEDLFERRDGAWRIASRRVRIMGLE
jgi:3-phenylpropionate/cinnamic acid dioxygenase small subunit